jgi:hypothetical protein
MLPLLLALGPLLILIRGGSGINIKNRLYSIFLVIGSGVHNPLISSLGVCYPSFIIPFDLLVPLPSSISAINYPNRPTQFASQSMQGCPIFRVSILPKCVQRLR